MIEITVINSIEEYTGIPAYMEVPEMPPERYAVVECVGGSINETISNSLVAVQTYAASLYDAAADCDTVTQALLYQMVNKPDIASVNVNGGKVNFTIPDSKQYRYQVIFEIAHY